MEKTLNKSNKSSFLKRTGQALKDFFNLKTWLKDLRSIPALAVTFCVLTSVLMNILANKEIINIQFSQHFVLIQDAGLIFSWCGFLAGDLIVRAFGSKTAVRVSITAVLISLFVSCMLLAASKITGTWGESFAYMTEEGLLNETGQAVNIALNNTIGSVWYVVIGSAAASLVGLIFNNITQGTLLKRITARHGDHYWGFVLASTISTGIGQFLDNIVFALLVGRIFFGWQWAQIFGAATLGLLVEVVAELVFTPITYRISQNWKRNKIGN